MKNYFKFDLKEFLKGLLLSNLIAGLGYFVILYFSMNLGLELLTAFLNSFFVIVVLAITGCYCSFNDEKHSIINTIGAVLGINISYTCVRLYAFETIDIFTTDFIKLLCLLTLMGLLGGRLKFVTLKNKENPINYGLDYESAKKYKMAMPMRIIGTILGTLFVLLPCSFFFKDFNEEMKHEPMLNIFISLFFLSAVLMGLFFLSYCIPGKTPNYVLKWLKSQNPK